MILIICLLVPMASAVNNTTANVTTQFNVTQNVTQNVTANITSNVTPTLTRILPSPEQFYGNATYSDGTPVLKGSPIIAKDQTGRIVGNFNMTSDGVYGDQYASSPKLIVNGESSDDTISFYVGDARSTGKTMKFNSGATKLVDIIISATSKFTPTAAPTTIIATPIVTAPIVTPAPIVTAPVVTPAPIVTAVPTPVITAVSTAVPTTIAPVPATDDATPKFVGVLLISIAVCVVGAILTYFILTKKMKRDDEEEILL